jgi:CDP-diacylglycerol---serine O-phosphatidyltransferase
VRKASLEKLLRVNRRFLLPTIISLANMFCGFSAILLSAAGRFESAVWIIVVAAVFDVADGKVARASGQTSEFGLQMDSLCDVISFGVAPSFLIYQFHMKTLGVFGIVISFLPLVFAAIRLARFNVYAKENIEHKGTIGLASPMGAIGLASIIYLSQHYNWHLFDLFLILMVPIISLLMVSTIYYSRLPEFSFKSSKGNRFKLFLFTISFALLPFFPHHVLFGFMMTYIISGPLEAIINSILNNSHYLPEDGK